MNDPNSSLAEALAAIIKPIVKEAALRIANPVYCRNTRELLRDFFTVPKLCP